MTFLEAAWRILNEVGDPLHYREITNRAIEQGLVETEGKTSARTMNAQLSTDIRAGDSRFRRVDRGVYGLTQWRSDTDRELPTPSPAEPDREYLT